MKIYPRVPSAFSRKAIASLHVWQWFVVGEYMSLSSCVIPGAVRRVTGVASYQSFVGLGFAMTVGYEVIL